VFPEGVDENNVGGEDNEDEEEEEEEDNDEEDEDVTHQHNGHTFEEALTEGIDLIVEFAKGLKHQLQFQDRRMLNALEREGASFLRLVKACMEKERRMNSTRGPTVSMWEKSTSSAMFYRTRPTLVDQST